MKVFTCNSFTGRWPTGAAAVVVAEDETEARDLLEAALEKIGLKQEVDLYQLTPIDTAHTNVVILCDGD